MMPTWIWIFIFLAAGLFVLKISYVLSTAMVLPITQGALFVSSSRARIAAFFDVLIDIGCGDGRVLRKASKCFGAKAIGYEVNLLAYIKARLLCMGDRNIQIKCKSFWNEKLTAADVVFCYLYPDVMKRLSDKLRSDLKPGTVVASCNFPLPGFRPQKILRPGGSLHNDPLYIYQI